MPAPCRAALPPRCARCRTCRSAAARAGALSAGSEEKKSAQLMTTHHANASMLSGAHHHAEVATDDGGELHAAVELHACVSAWLASKQGDWPTRARRATVQARTAPSANESALKRPLATLGERSTPLGSSFHFQLRDTRTPAHSAHWKATPRQRRHARARRAALCAHVNRSPEPSRKKMKTVKGTAKLVMARYSVRRKACAPSLMAL